MQNIPACLKNLAQALPQPLYVVGGAVRNHIAGLVPARPDWDICSPAPAEEVCAAALPLGFTLEAQFPSTGSLKLRFGGDMFEYTRFRTDSYGGLGHAPQRVVFTGDIKQDALRRDFKCNAVYYDICAGQLVDPLGGAEDIRNKILSPCRPAGVLFAEDALRILRLFRFAGELGFAPTPLCLKACAENAPALKHIAPVLLGREADGIFAADEKYGNAGGCAAALGHMADTGVAGVLFPAVCALGGGGLARSVNAAAAAPAGLRVYALLCLAGKQGVEEAAALFGWPRSRRERALALVSAATAPLDRSLAAGSFGYADDVAALRSALWGREAGREYLSLIGDMLAEGVPMDAGGLAVRGNDLIEAGVPPQKVGKTLNYLLALCLDDGSLNKREVLIAAALQYCE